MMLRQGNKDNQEGAEKTNVLVEKRCSLVSTDDEHSMIVNISYASLVILQE
jgi:hypothetical protein